MSERGAEAREISVKIWSVDETRHWHILASSKDNVEELRSKIADEADYLDSQIRLVCEQCELLNMDETVGDIVDGKTRLNVTLVPSGAADLEVFVKVRPVDVSLTPARFAINSEAPLQWLVDKICR